MAQPFEQVLESLRAVASGKLNQLEERSRGLPERDRRDNRGPGGE